jgi:alpha-tubulin suppressor-like RCC1 family protein
MAAETQTIAAGANHTCVVARGEVLCFGYNLYGQLGRTEFGTFEARAVPGISNAQTVAAGSQFACALLADETVSCWGNNDVGQLGRGMVGGDRTSLSTPVPIAALKARALFAGASSACALTPTGELACWGNNPVANSSSPRLVSTPGISVSSVTLGLNHLCLRTPGGGAVCAGSNANGELGDGTRDLRLTFEQPKGLAAISSLHASRSSTCALLTTGSVKCWGGAPATYGGELGNGIRGPQLVPDDVVGVTDGAELVAGELSVIARSPTRGALLWGRDLAGSEDHHEPIRFSALDGFSDISLGYLHGCGFDEARLYCWGVNTFGQLPGRLLNETVPPYEIVLP